MEKPKKGKELNMELNHLVTFEVEAPSSPQSRILTSILNKLFSPIVFAIMAIALANLLSWVANLPALRALPPKASPMSLNSSVLFCLISLCLLGNRSTKKPYRYACPAVAALILAVGLLTLAEYLSGIAFGIDGDGFPFYSLRMSPFSAASFSLIGLALLLTSLFPSKGNAWTQILIVAAAMIALFNSIGYLYSISVFYKIASFKPISVGSSFCFIISAIAILLLRPKQNLMRLVLEESYGGLIIRRFLLYVLTLPILLGGMTSLVIRLQLIPEPHAILSMVLLTILTFLILLLINGRAISLAESKMKKAEGVARKSESNYRELFANINNCVCICSPSENGSEFQILDVNKAAEETEGIKKREVVGKEIGQGLPALKDFGIDALIRKVWATGTPNSGEHSIELGGAETLWRRSWIYKLPSGEVVTIYDDVTASKRAEKEEERLKNQLFQARKMEAIGRLAGGIAHDFNNFLTVIVGYCNLLSADSPLKEAQLDDLEEIIKAATGASHLVKQLLAFGRKQLLKPELVDMNEIIENISKILKTLIGERIELELRLYPELCPVLVDASQLAQVIMNLAANARDAMPDGGSLTLMTECCSSARPGMEPGEYVVLTVTDTGKGMDKETLENIFEPFFTTKEMGMGTGLGLSTVYGIIKQSNGAIYPYSEPGKGSTFKIYLPAAAGKVPSKTGSRGGNIQLHGSGIILVVEDDPALRAYIKRVLLQYGYLVIDAGDGESAVHLAETDGLRLDLLVTDVIMPKMNGREVSEKLRRLHPDMGVLYISGYTKDILGEEGVLDQDLNFIAKPFDAETLLKKVRQMLVDIAGRMVGQQP